MISIGIRAYQANSVSNGSRCVGSGAQLLQADIGNLETEQSRRNEIVSFDSPGDCFRFRKSSRSIR
jgi:hypothetical protein